jgi:hypothetical protein
MSLVLRGINVLIIATYRAVVIYNVDSTCGSRRWIPSLSFSFSFSLALFPSLGWKRPLAQRETIIARGRLLQRMIVNRAVKGI